MRERKTSCTSFDSLNEYYSKNIDITLLRENLKRSVEERFEYLMEQQKLADELRRAGKEAKKK